MPVTTEMTWTSGRWHLDGRPIHAGTVAEMQFPDKTWLAVRLETADGGHKLFAHFEFHGLGLRARVDPDGNDGYDAAPLRWLS